MTQPLNKHLNPKTNDTFEIYKFQTTIQDSDETVQQFCNRLRSIDNRCNFENEDKHIETQLILGTRSQKSCKCYFTNPTVSLEEVVKRGKLFEEVDEQTGVPEDSKSINEIKSLEKNEQSLRIQLKQVRYNCTAHRSAHLFIIAISSHSHIKWKQPRSIFFFNMAAL